MVEIFSYSPYELPTIDFVGGETQKIAFSMFHYVKGRPFELYGCKANFSVVNFTNKFGEPLLSKEIPIDENAKNLLLITLLPEETVNLYGKYIYQISIFDDEGESEIPKQGILLISNNINKDFIYQNVTPANPA